MKLLLVRHARAEERDASKWPDDASRPLSENGINEFRTAAGYLGPIETPDVLLTSPYLRAVQTAALLESDAKWPTPVQTQALVDEQFTDLIAHHFHSGTQTLALVGHEPSLSALISTLISGNGKAAVNVEPGAVALLHLESSSSGELQWLIPPFPQPSGDSTR